jgi:hypothetical protein
MKHTAFTHAIVLSLILLLPVSSAQENGDAPQITGFDPPSAEAGETILILGENLLEISSVRFNGIEAEFSASKSGLLISAVVPLEATSGTVTVTASGIEIASPEDFIVLVPAPFISSFFPAGGLPGTVVEIQGGNIEEVASVTFNGVVADFNILTPGTLSAVVPSAAESGPISINTPGGTATSESSFTVLTLGNPVITSFSPTSGEPGSSVNIQGQNLTNLTAVTIGGVEASFRYFLGLISATVPSGANTGPITITTTAGIATSQELFTILAPGEVTFTSFSPNSGVADTQVEIRGANLKEVTSVRFNGVEAEFLLFSGVLYANVPPNATTGLITLETPAGELSSTEPFTVLGPQPPSIASFSPDTAPPGASVDIHGEHLVDVTSVRFNGMEAVFTNVFANLVIATVPLEATSGPITVTTSAGSVTTASHFTVEGSSSSPPPIISVKWASANQIEIAWKKEAAGFVLQAASTLSDPSGWEDVQSAPVERENDLVVTQNSDSGHRFFRLRRP